MTPVLLSLLKFAMIQKNVYSNVENLIIKTYNFGCYFGCYAVYRRPIFVMSD